MTDDAGPPDPESLGIFSEAARKAIAPILEEIRKAEESTNSMLEAQRTAIERSIAPILEAQRRAIEESVAPFVRAQMEALNNWRETNKDFLESLQRGAERFREAWEEAVPPNLRDLDADELSRTLEISLNEGLCVVWAPRAEIVQELLAREAYADRAALLIERRDDVLVDLTTVLCESTHEVLEEQGEVRTFARLAIDAARQGHDAAAQALAAAALACVLEEVRGYPRLKAAREDMKGHDIEETDIWRLRIVAVELATSNALGITKEHSQGFNRHGTLHGLSAFFGHGEMLSALLLLVNWVRELSWWAEHDPTFLVDEHGHRQASQ